MAPRHLCFCVAAHMVVGIMVPLQPLSLDAQDEARSAEDAKSQLSKLDASLTRLHGKINEHLLAHKAKLERSLQKAQERNALLEANNSAMLSNILATEASNAVLHKQANTLLAMNSQLQAVMQSLRSNLSVAGEFMDGAINTSVSLQTAPELQILHELAAQDSEAQLMAAKEAQRRQIETGEAIAMLQRSQGHDDEHDGKHGGKKHYDSKSNFDELVATLATQWGEVSKAGDTAKASLDAAFEQSFNKTYQEGAALNQTATELKERLDAATQLNIKLNAAVKSLNDTHHVLEKRLSQLHNFAMHLQEMFKSEDVRDRQAENEHRNKTKGKHDKSLLRWGR